MFFVQQVLTNLLGKINTGDDFEAKSRKKYNFQTNVTVFKQTSQN